MINTEVGSDKCYEEDKREYCQRECLGLGVVVLAREVRSIIPCLGHLIPTAPTRCGVFRLWNNLHSLHHPRHEDVEEMAWSPGPQEGLYNLLNGILYNVTQQGS